MRDLETHAGPKMRKASWGVVWWCATPITYHGCATDRYQQIVCGGTSLHEKYGRQEYPDLIEVARAS